MRQAAQSPPPKLLDLPEAVLSRICAYVARRPIFDRDEGPHGRELPYGLLALGATCKTLRRLTALECGSLTFEAYTSWKAYVSWLRFAHPHVRSVRIGLLPTQIELSLLRYHQVLPPAVALSSLTFHHLPLVSLDLSGLALFHQHDALLLSALLKQIRCSLTRLVLLDAGSAFKHVVDAVVTAQLCNLKSFTYLSLRADCRQALIGLFTSFLSPPSLTCSTSTTTTTTTSTIFISSTSSSRSYSNDGMVCNYNFDATEMTSKSEIVSRSQMVPINSNGTTSKPDIQPSSLLTRLHLHMQEPTNDVCFTKDDTIAGLCPNLTHFTFESEFESPIVIPHRFINAFRSLRVLLLKDVILDHRLVNTIMSCLCNLEEIQLDGCLILHDDETLVHRVNEPFLQVVSTCKAILTGLWLPARYFSSAELIYFTKVAPPLRALALTLPTSALSVLPQLCGVLSGTLEKLRLCVVTEDGAIMTKSLSSKDERYVVDAILKAEKVKSLHWISIFMSIDGITKVLRKMNKRLQAFYTEVNINDCVDQQVQHTLQLLQAVATFSHGLHFFCVENEVPKELPHHSESAQRLRKCVEDVLDAAPFLSSTNLRSLLSVWIAHEPQQQPLLISTSTVDVSHAASTAAATTTLSTVTNNMTSSSSSSNNNINSTPTVITLNPASSTVVVVSQQQQQQQLHLHLQEDHE